MLGDLRRVNAPFRAAIDAFDFADAVFGNFDFVFHSEESGLRRLELVVSLFDHLAIECVNEVAGILDGRDPVGGPVPPTTLSEP